MREYRFRKNDGDWSRDLPLDELMGIARNQVEPGHAPYQVTQDGVPITLHLPRDEALQKYRRAISNREIGPVFRLRDDRDVQFTARATQGISDADTTSGNENADIFWNWIRSRFEDFDPRFAGAYVCKKIVGSTQLSQHSHGNAVDVFVDTLDHQDRVADEAVVMRDQLSLGHLISKQRIWTPSQGWHQHLGEFHGHLHGDFLPQFTGVCGVKGEL